MENNNLENLIKKIKISLTESEKGNMRNFLISHIENSRPAPTLERKPVKSDLFFGFNLLFSRYAVVPIVAFFLLAGTSYAAQNSLPGDLLYPVKTNVNEKVAGVFATTPLAKAKREAVLLERRLDEARELIVQEKFSPERKLLVEEQFEKHNENIKNHLVALRMEEDLNQVLALQSDLEISLQINERLISDAANRTSAEAVSITSKIKDELSLVSQEKSETEEVLNQKPQSESIIVAQERMKLALKALEESESSFIKEFSLEKQPFSLLKSERLLKEAKGKFEEGKSLMGVDMYREAVNSFNEVIKLSKKIKALRESETFLDVEVKEDVGVEIGTESADLISGEVQGEFKSQGAESKNEAKEAREPNKENLENRLQIIKFNQ